MKAIFRSLACALAGAAIASATPPTAVRTVVLDNENLLEGEVVRVEEGYEIRQPSGSSVTIPASRVLAVVANRKAAFRVIADRSNRGDADERLRLAHWCATNGLPEQALAEARAAAKMRRGFVAAERYVEFLEETANRKRPQSVAAVIQAKAEAPKTETVTEVPIVDYNSESFPLFATRINAILVNTCANCHANGVAKTFRLTRAGGRSAVTRNMMAALPFVNPKDPAASPILTKALLPHGTATEAPFKTRTHPAYQALAIWAQIARAPMARQRPRFQSYRSRRNCRTFAGPARRFPRNASDKTATRHHPSRPRMRRPIRSTRRSSTVQRRRNDGRHFTAVAGPEGVDRVRDPDVRGHFLQMTSDLHQAADIAHEDGLRSGLLNVRGFAIAELRRPFPAA